MSASSRPFTREPTLFELVARFALGAAPRALALSGAFQLAAAAAVLSWFPASATLALPMIGFASASAWGLAAQASRAEDGPVRALAIAGVRHAAALTGVLALVAFALAFFVGTLGTSWLS